MDVDVAVGAGVVGVAGGLDPEGSGLLLIDAEGEFSAAVSNEAGPLIGVFPQAVSNKISAVPAAATMDLTVTPSWSANTRSTAGPAHQRTTVESRIVCVFWHCKMAETRGH
ncbi:hypothetical protein GCM10009712_16830 [Pseudarthrobacter sulfonivorans]